MISSQNVACTATFMAFGMFEADTKKRLSGPDGISTYDIYTVWGNGAVELHFELAQYAELSEKIVQYFVGRDHDFPGVYDYEVSEPFGTWFAEFLFANGVAPPIITAERRLIELACQFFTKGRVEKLVTKVTEHLK